MINMTIKELANLKENRLKDILYDETSLEELKSLNNLVSANTIIDINSQIKDLKNKKKESKEKLPVKKYKKGGQVSDVKDVVNRLSSIVGYKNGGLIPKPKKYQSGGEIVSSSQDSLGTGSSIMDSLILDYFDKTDYDLSKKSEDGYFSGIPRGDQELILENVWNSMTEKDSDRVLAELGVSVDNPLAYKDSGVSSGEAEIPIALRARNERIDKMVNRYNELSDEINMYYGHGATKSPLAAPGWFGNTTNALVDFILMSRMSHGGGKGDKNRKLSTLLHGIPTAGLLKAAEDLGFVSNIPEDFRGWGSHAVTAPLKNEQQNILKSLNDIYDIVYKDVDPTGNESKTYSKINPSSDLFHKNHPSVEKHEREFEPWKYSGTAWGEVWGQNPENKITDIVGEFLGDKIFEDIVEPVMEVDTEMKHIFHGLQGQHSDKAFKGTLKFLYDMMTPVGMYKEITSPDAPK